MNSGYDPSGPSVQDRMKSTVAVNDPGRNVEQTSQTFGLASGSDSMLWRAFFA